MCVSGMEAQCCVKLLDKPGSSLGVPHGCCALRTKRSNNKGFLIQRDEMQGDRAKVVSGIYITVNSISQKTMLISKTVINVLEK